MSSTRNTLGERSDLIESQDFFDLEDAPIAKELEVEWELPSTEQQRGDEEEEEEKDNAQRRVRARRGVPDFNRRPSFEYEDFKKNAYDRLSMFDQRR